MKKTRASSLIRLVAFLLIATLLLCLVGFSAGGWHSTTDNERDSDKAEVPSGEVDENKDGQTADELRKFYDLLTGREVTEEHSKIAKAAFVMSSNTPCYGISEADLVIEMPTEDGTTRLLVFTDAINSLGKIGAIAPTRGFISTLALSFDAILISGGCDDTVEYDSVEAEGLYFDLTAATGYSYTEYTHYIYSNCDLIKAGLSNGGYSLVNTSSDTLPYLILHDSDAPTGNSAASSVMLRFSESKSTELYYDSVTKRYTAYENGTQKTDLLYDRGIEYDNVFVLFADSVTYESEGSSELVLSTLSSGRGYYASNGAVREILWKSVDGKMVFTDTDGQILTVNAGESYIGFLKSSERDSLVIS